MVFTLTLYDKSRDEKYINERFSMLNYTIESLVYRMALVVGKQQLMSMIGEGQLILCRNYDSLSH